MFQPNSGLPKAAAFLQKLIFHQRKHTLQETFLCAQGAWEQRCTLVPCSWLPLSQTSPPSHAAHPTDPSHPPCGLHPRDVPHEMNSLARDLNQKETGAWRPWTPHSHVEWQWHKFCWKVSFSSTEARAFQRLQEGAAQTGAGGAHCNPFPHTDVKKHKVKQPEDILAFSFFPSLLWKEPVLGTKNDGMEKNRCNVSSRRYPDTLPLTNLPHPGGFLETAEPTARCIQLNYIPMVLQCSTRAYKVCAARGAQWTGGTKWLRPLKEPYSTGEIQELVALPLSHQAGKVGCQSPHVPASLTCTEPLSLRGQNPSGASLIKV